MIGAMELTLAFFLDLLIGDPQWAPHPVRIMGAAIDRGERFWRRFFSSPSGERLGGALLVVSIVVPVYFISTLIVTILRQAPERGFALLGTAAIVYLTATTIATRELLRSAGSVISAVGKKDIESARRRVGMIVGRDTASLSDKGVLKAAIESLAENLSDGVVAPLFYLALGGLPLALCYKAVNTLDSMVGYKNDRYRWFGWAAARLDDAANYVPARITGALLVSASFLVSLARDIAKTLEGGGRRGEGRSFLAMHAARRSFMVMARDGGKHPSPNSGIPEASMAGALGVRLGGPSSYGGVLSDKPYIGDEKTDDYLSAAMSARTLVGVSSALAALIAASAIGLRGAL